MRGKPVGTILLCLVVVAASFLPWGTMGLDEAMKDAPGLGDFARSMAKGFGMTGIEVNAWNSHVTAGALRIPVWVVPVLAAFVGLSVWLRAADAWTPPRFLCPLLVVVAEAVAAWMTVALGSSKDGTIGIGVIATLVALSSLLVGTLLPQPAPAVAAP